MLSRSGVPRYQTISLDRAAKLTGEAFGFEDSASIERSGSCQPLATKALWMIAGLAALAGLAYIAIR